MATKLDISQIVATLAVAYPSFQPTDETFQVYFALLKDLDSDLLSAAAMQCATEPGRKFAPSVGEIRGAAAQIKARSDGVPSSAEAWAEVLAAPVNGLDRQVTDETDEQGRIIILESLHRWSHPLVGKIAKDLGYPDKFPTDNLVADRAQWMKAYEIAVVSHSNQDVELPEVKAYIEQHQPKRLGTGESMKMLADRMGK